MVSEKKFNPLKELKKAGEKVKKAEQKDSVSESGGKHAN